MFLLRRSAVRAIRAANSKFVAAPRSITSLAPAARLRQQQWPTAVFQRRFNSDGAKTPDNFAQTAAETPLEDGLTPAEPQSSEAALNAAAEDSTPQFTRKPRQREQLEPTKSIYVGNLFYEVTAEQITRIFSRFGEIENVRIIHDNNGQSRGFGYVDYKNLADAQAAVENLDMQVFEGRNMVCQFNRPRENNPRRNDRNSDRNSAERTPRAPAAPSDSLFIGNMSFEMSDKDLNDLFRDVPNVLDVRVAIDRRTGQPRGFAHADFSDIESATKAKEALSNKTVYGRELRVDFSNPVRRDERRGGDRRGDRGQRRENRPRRDSPAEE